MLMIDRVAERIGMPREKTIIQQIGEANDIHVLVCQVMGDVEVFDGRICRFKATRDVGGGIFGGFPQDEKNAEDGLPIPKRPKWNRLCRRAPRMSAHSLFDALVTYAIEIAQDIEKQRLEMPA